LTTTGTRAQDSPVGMSKTVPDVSLVIQIGQQIASQRIKEVRVRKDKSLTIVQILSDVTCLLCWRVGKDCGRETTTCEVRGQWEYYIHYSKATAPASVVPKKVKGKEVFQENHKQWKERIWQNENHEQCWRCIFDRDDPKFHIPVPGEPTKATCKYEGVVSVMAWIIRHDNKLREAMGKDLGIPELKNVSNYETWLAMGEEGNPKTRVASTYLVIWFYNRYSKKVGYPKI